MFHGSLCLSSCQYRTVLITRVLYYILITVSAYPLALLLLKLTSLSLVLCIFTIILASVCQLLQNNFEILIDFFCIRSKDPLGEHLTSLYYCIHESGISIYLATHSILSMFCNLTHHVIRFISRYVFAVAITGIT